VRIQAEVQAAQQAALAADATQRQAVPLHMSAFAAELAAQLPADAILYDESITYTPELTRHVVPERPGSLFQTPGGTLGIAFPGAIGVKLAHPERTVIGLGGDGGAMYTLPALWTAAHERIAAKFVLCHNRSYRLLKSNLVAYWRDRGIAGNAFPPSFDLADPEIDFVAMARGMGVAGRRVSQPSEVAAAIGEMLAHDGPFLLEVMLEDAVQR
jgi:benzoylformate decarboxylase